MLPILPPAPSRTDPSNFSSKADAWVDSLASWTNAANALEQSLQIVATTGTSTSSLPIGTGSKGLTTQTGKVWGVGSWVYIVAASSISNMMQGQITAYNSGTGSLVVNVTNATGSGTFTSWIIGLAVPPSVAGNISGGLAGSIPYQTAVNTTAMRAIGTQGQVLRVNSGLPEWANLSPGGLLAVRVLGGTGSYTPTAGTVSIVVELQAAGGQGGGSAITSSGQASAGAGGHGGSYVKFRMSSGFSGASYSVGLGGSASGPATNGTNGGNTTFLGGSASSTGITVYGGPGGKAGTAASTNQITGIDPKNNYGYQAGASFGGQILFATIGGPGLNGLVLSGGTGVSGAGGAAVLSCGNVQSVTSTGGTPSNDINGPGAGGGGALSLSSHPTGYAGAPGSNGQIIIWEYA